MSPLQLAPYGQRSRGCVGWFVDAERTGRCRRHYEKLPGLFGWTQGLFPPSGMARECGSSDLFICLLRREASAPLKASVPMKGALEGFKWFGGFRALRESKPAINPPANCAESGPSGDEKAGGICTLLEPRNILPPCSHLPGRLSSCWAAAAKAPACPGCCSLIRHGLCN